MSQDIQRLRRRASKASFESVVTYEPFNTPERPNQTMEIPTISVDHGDEEVDKEGDQGSILRPRFTSDTFDSSYTNSRTNTYERGTTNTNEDSFLYRGSVSNNNNRDDQGRRGEPHPVVLNKLNDKMPAARPNVDYQDKLWTQIDVLDDVKRMSEQTSMDNDSFFNAQHSKALNELKMAQVELLSRIRDSEKLIDTNFDHKEIWDSSDIEGIRDKLYNKTYFDSIALSVDKVNEKLDSVGQSMKNIDDLTRDIWQS